MSAVTFFLELLVEVPEVDGLVRGYIAGQHLRRRRRRGRRRRRRARVLSGRKFLVAATACWLLMSRPRSVGSRDGGRLIPWALFRSEQWAVK
jgi:hypothetical protein